MKSSVSDFLYYSHTGVFHDKSNLEWVLSMILDSKPFHWIKVVFVPCLVAVLLSYAYVNTQKAFSSLWYA